MRSKYLYLKLCRIYLKSTCANCNRCFSTGHVARRDSCSVLHTISQTCYHTGQFAEQYLLATHGYPETLMLLLMAAVFVS